MIWNSGHTYMFSFCNLFVRILVEYPYLLIINCQKTLIYNLKTKYKGGAKLTEQSLLLIQQWLKIVLKVIRRF